MALNIVKLCYGTASTQALRDRIERTFARAGADAAGLEVAHVTRTFPTRAAEIVGQGSLYWVMKGQILGRQAILDLRQFKDEQGVDRCRIVLAREVVDVEPRPKKAFQGWRYLAGEDAPKDMSEGVVEDLAEMPDALRRELAGLGLI